MLIDTVGLVRRLPHNLVEAFKSTLEEAASADVLLCVCDASSPEMDEQIEVTTSLLAELGAADTPMIKVLNKCDLVPGLRPLDRKDTVLISAREKTGFEELLSAIMAALEPSQKRLKLLLPYTAAGAAGRDPAGGQGLFGGVHPRWHSGRCPGAYPGAAQGGSLSDLLTPWIQKRRMELFHTPFLLRYSVLFRQDHLVDAALAASGRDHIGEIGQKAQQQRDIGCHKGQQCQQEPGTFFRPAGTVMPTSSPMLNTQIFSRAKSCQRLFAA